MTGIVLASVIAALFFGPGLNLIGLRWRWAWLLAVLMAAGLGLSAASSIGLI